MNHQSGEEGIRHHCATENHSPIGLKPASESFRKYALTRGHRFKYLRQFKNRQRIYDRKIKLLSELKKTLSSLRARRDTDLEPKLESATAGAQYADGRREMVQTE
jgi:hypothetical protein